MSNSVICVLDSLTNSFVLVNWKTKSQITSPQICDVCCYPWVMLCLLFILDLSLWMIVGLGMAVVVLLIIAVAGFTHMKRYSHI